MSDNEEKITDAFKKIYDENIWGKGSGTGSLPLKNIKCVAFLSEFLVRNQISSVLDFGCGDWQFSRYICWDNINYLGVDVVESVIAENQSNFTKLNVQFQHLTGTADVDSLPNFDLIVSKDVIQHLPVDIIKDRLERLRKRCKYMLITNDVYPDKWLNVDIEPGGGRAIRLMEEPFNMKCTVVYSDSAIAYGNFTDKECVLIQGDLL